MRVWIDIDNAPHVQVFRPIISRLRAQGASVEITARGRTFVPELLDAAGISHTVISRGQPAGFAAKATALVSRALSLARFAADRRFDVAVGHGSRSLPLAARIVRVPNLTMFDYEHVSTWLFRRFCDRILVPRIIADGTNGSLSRGPWRTFDGFKEELYLSEFRPDSAIRSRLGVGDHEILAIVRPPSRTAHYRDDRSEEILEAVTRRIAREKCVRAVWLKRDPGDAPPPLAWGAENVIAPDLPVDGPSLLASADLVISGGGTMNREAALLGTPAYSIFTGRLGALDAELIRLGRLTQIGGINEVNRITFERRHPGGRPLLNSGLCEFVIDQIDEVARHG